MRFFGRLTQVVVAPLLPVVGVAAAVAVVATSASAGVAPAVVRPAEKLRVRHARKTVTAKCQLKKR